MVDQHVEIEQIFNDMMIWVSQMIPQYSVRDLYDIPDITTILMLTMRAEAIQKERERKNAKE